MRSRRTRRTAALAVAGVTAVAALSGCGSIYDAPLPGGADVGSHPITVHARFRDVLDLVPQSTVKVDDVTVGKVTAIKLDGYTADVTMKLKRSVDLPDNATAQIQQTSLLGEKFVALDAPSTPSAARLTSGDVIGLAHTGRNPEVEEVLSALALLLNGGGVGQLKSIASELNDAVGGREGDVRSVISQLRYLTGQLDRNRGAIVRAIDNLNRLAATLRKQDGTIKVALDELPAALKSINGQRADLVKVLKALDDLSDVGVRVIDQSKVATTQTLRDLGPVLAKLADAGQSLPNSLQVLFTYPFVDAAVGNSPVVARNLKMGDYVNLSIRLDLDLNKLPTIPGLPGLPEQTCKQLDQVENTTKANIDKAMKQVLDPILKALPVSQAKKDQITKTIHQDLVDDLVALAKKECRSVSAADVTAYLKELIPDVLKSLLPAGVLSQAQQALDQVGAAVGIGKLGSALLGGDTAGGNGGGLLGNGTGGGLLGQLGLGRAALGTVFRKPSRPDDRDPFQLAARGVDPSMGTLLLQGVSSAR